MKLVKEKSAGPHGIILEPAAAIGYDCIQELNTYYEGPAAARLSIYINVCVDVDS